MVVDQQRPAQKVSIKFAGSCEIRAVFRCFVVKGKPPVEIVNEVKIIYDGGVVNRTSGIASSKTSGKNREWGSCFRKSTDLCCKKQSQKPSNIGNCLQDGFQNR